MNLSVIFLYLYYQLLPESDAHFVYALRWISTCPFGDRNGNENGNGHGTDLKRENNKANKVVFDWLFKNNKNAAFAKISRFDWLSLGFPVSVREKVDLNLTFSREQTDRKIFLWESKNIKLRMPT